MDKSAQWLARLNKITNEKPRPEPDTNAFDAFMSLYGHSGSIEAENPAIKTFGLHGEVSEVPDVVKKMVERAPFDVLAKGIGVVAYAGWDAELTVPVSADFYQRSDERFKKVVAVIERVFGSRPECQEAISIARRMRDEARAEVLARAAA